MGGLPCYGAEAGPSQLFFIHLVHEPTKSYIALKLTAQQYLIPLHCWVPRLPGVVTEANILHNAPQSKQQLQRGLRRLTPALPRIRSTGPQAPATGAAQRFWMQWMLHGVSDWSAGAAGGIGTPWLAQADAPREQNACAALAVNWHEKHGAASSRPQARVPAVCATGTHPALGPASALAGLSP